jgi:hypothetical protein
MKKIKVIKKSIKRPKGKLKDYHYIVVVDNFAIDCDTLK